MAGVRTPIAINDIFFFINKIKIANYADYSTTYTSGENIESLLKTLQEETLMALKWFNVNEMKSNDDKCQLIVANQDNISITLGNECIEAEDSVETFRHKNR